MSLEDPDRNQERDAADSGAGGFHGPFGGKLERDFYEQWKRRGRHIEEYGSELLGTAFLLFCVVGVVAVLEAKGSPVVAAIPSGGLRLFIIGLILGGAGWLVALSGPGRLSGAHLNPALSLGFWALGKMYPRDVFGYIAGQMLGAAGGTWIGALVFGRWAREVAHATLHPGPKVSYGWAFGAEVATTFALTLAIYTFVSHKRLARWTPAMVTLVVGVLVWLDGNFSGCGMNPARWFGPALSISYWGYTLVYAIGPIAGAILAALLRRTGILTNPMPHTGKIYHDERYRSVFKKDSLPSRPPASVHQSSDQ